MIALKVKEIRDNELVLVSKDSRIFTVKISFMNLYFPKVGDLLQIDEKLLDRNSEYFCPPYTFGSLDSIYGRDMTAIPESDLLYIKSGTDIIKLKRLYG